MWQYITLMKRIYLIDCPGIVYPQGDSESALILKGVVSESFLFICCGLLILSGTVLFSTSRRSPIGATSRTVANVPIHKHQ